MTSVAERYNRSWVTQKVLNRAPEWSRARRSPVSVAQQICNVPALEIEDTLKKLDEERDNSILATCDPTLLDRLYKVTLPGRFEFSLSEDQDRWSTYYTPSVWGEIDNSETSISRAPRNSVESLFYETTPTRTEYGGRSEIWEEVVPPTLVSDLSSVSPTGLSIEGPLYITLSDNTVWSEEYKDSIYFTKIYLKGTGLLDESIEEMIPLRLNGTYQTRRHWKTLSEFSVFHASESAKVSISVFPFRETPVAHEREIATNIDGAERDRFYSMRDYSWGSALAAERYLVDDDDQIRMGLDLRATDYELELWDGEGGNVSANAFVFKPHSDWMYVVDDDYLYVFDYRLPFPSTTYLGEGSGDSRFAIRFVDDKYFYTREDQIKFFTRTLEYTSIPFAVRWTLIWDDGTEYRIGVDGSLWESSEQEGWIYNDLWGEGRWEEQSITLSPMGFSGTYTLKLEAKYEEVEGIVTRTTKEAFCIPAIEPEAKLLLPATLRGAWDLGIDGEGKLWFYNGTSILLADLYYDYFIVDFQSKTVWLREQYPSVRVRP